MKKEIPNKINHVKVEIIQRTKKDPITIEGSIDIKDGCWINRENGFNKSRADKINLKITLTPEDWQKLWSFSLNYPEDFISQWRNNLILPALNEFNNKKGARGKGKNIKHLIDWIKTDAGNLYVFLHYWFKQPRTNWPDYMNKLIDKFKKDGYETDGATNSGKAVLLTAYCIDKVHGKATKDFLKPFFEPEERISSDNFFITYIRGDKGAIRVAKKNLENKSPDQVANLAFSPPLNTIFNHLKASQII